MYFNAKHNYSFPFENYQIMTAIDHLITLGQGKPTFNALVIKLLEQQHSTSTGGAGLEPGLGQI